MKKIILILSIIVFSSTAYGQSASGGLLRCCMLEGVFGKSDTGSLFGGPAQPKPPKPEHKPGDRIISIFDAFDSDNITVEICCLPKRKPNDPMAHVPIGSWF